MSVAVLLWLLPVTAQGIGPPTPDPSLYRKCPDAAPKPGRANQLSWVPRPSRAADHIRLRERVGLAMPKGDRRILLYSRAEHHTSLEVSVIVVRGKGGRWRTDRIVERGPGLLDVPREAGANIVRDIPSQAGRRLDRLLADKCLTAMPSFMFGTNSSVGDAFMTLEVETPRRRWTGAWVVESAPIAGEIVHLITDSALR